MQKVRADIDLAGTISEEEYVKRLEAKNFEKMQKRAVLDNAKAERLKAREDRLKKISEAKELFSKTRLTHEIWVGQRFGRLVVIDSYIDSGKTYWVCQCDCGRVVTKLAKLVKFGHYISCGCISKEIRENSYSGERLYGIWHNMKYRCLNPNSKEYHNYGGRGISICKEWLESYQAFKKWAYNNGWTEELHEQAKDNLSIERIDVNGNYCPENCKFIPLWQQAYNKRPYCERERIFTKRDREMITIDGETKSRREWQEKFGISNATLGYRMRVLKMTEEKALSTPKWDWLKR